MNSLLLYLTISNEFISIVLTIDNKENILNLIFESFVSLETNLLFQYKIIIIQNQ